MYLHARYPSNHPLGHVSENQNPLVGRWWVGSGGSQTSMQVQWLSLNHLAHCFPKLLSLFGEFGYLIPHCTSGTSEKLSCRAVVQEKGYTHIIPIVSQYVISYNVIRKIWPQANMKFTWDFYLCPDVSTISCSHVLCSQVKRMKEHPIASTGILHFFFWLNFKKFTKLRRYYLEDFFLAIIIGFLQ